MRNQISQLSSQLKDPRINADSDIRIQNLNEQILKLEQEKTDLENELRNVKNELKTRLQVAESEIDQYKIRLGDERRTTIVSGTYDDNRRTTIVSAGETPSRV